MPSDIRYACLIRFNHTLVQEGASRENPANRPGQEQKHALPHQPVHLDVDLSVPHSTAPLEGFTSIYTAHHGPAYVNVLGGIVGGPLLEHRAAFGTVNAGFDHDAAERATQLLRVRPAI